MRPILSRKQFLKTFSLGLAVVLPKLDQPLKCATKSCYLQSCRLAGLSYYHYQEFTQTLQAGKVLELRAEPNNPHDPYAVEVFLPGQGKLGYLPRNCNHVVSHLLRQGQALRAEITRLHPEERIDRQLEIKIELLS
ncbi:MAG: hypothetical protein HC904_05035 [Blastochloris sp.]|nr:hypothetical protein [Blastochloris sp.]